MGMPDFYIKIKFKECAREQFESVFKSLASDNIFRITNGNESIELECKIDNFLPSVVLVYNVINKVRIVFLRLKVIELYQTMILTSLPNLLVLFFRLTKIRYWVITNKWDIWRSAQMMTTINNGLN